MRATGPVLCKHRPATMQSQRLGTASGTGRLVAGMQPKRPLQALNMGEA